jgi:glucose-1-phosphate thymidylyltransferase
MSDSTLKVVIPMAGLGTRLRPHTWSKPKQLISVAGRTVLDHVISSLSSYPKFNQIELINIVGYLGDQIETHVCEHYPEIKSHFVVQENPKGQSHAIMLAREYLQGPMLMVFADTLIETDLSSLDDELADAVVWVKPVDDPRRFGVAEQGDNGWVSRLIEKPQDMNNNLAVVGFYYFNEARDLLSAIGEQIERDMSLKGEYYLADAVNIMLERGLKMRTQSVDVWLDAGTRAALLETNCYLLTHGYNNNQEAAMNADVVIKPPVFIHHTAQIEASILGPNVSIGAGCNVNNSIIRDSILEDGAQAESVILENSLVGRRAFIRRRAGEINAGDNTEVLL